MKHEHDYATNCASHEQGARVWTIEASGIRSRRDYVATEEPLEIRVVSGTARRTVAVTMRTPGADFELAAGFLFNEGIIESREAIGRISYCVEGDAEQRYNIVNVALHTATLPDLAPLERHFVTRVPAVSVVVRALRRFVCAAIRRSPRDRPLPRRVSTPCPRNSEPRKGYSM